MIKKTFSKIDECVYYDKLSNGLEVYLYPTNKTKNFYISISVKYGANVTKYKCGNRVVDVIPGCAHFLEHKVMALSENKEIADRINSLGSLANAWTSYWGTNYNIFGSINIRENLKLLLDIFYNIDINDKNVNEEKGIIGEEIDMYKDQIDSYMYSSIYYNLFNDSYVKNTVVGERDDIEKINAKLLNEIYNDFYLTNNTFIIVTGNFDPNEILNDIKEYVKDFKQSKKKPKLIKKKDKEKVYVPYEEINKDSEKTRVKYALKISKDKFNIKDESLLKEYLDIIFSINFSTTSKLFENYKNNGIIIGMSYSINIIDGYVIITINSICDDSNLFLENVQKDIKKITINKEEFERKKKILLKEYVMEFDNIEDIEYIICTSLLKNNKINYKEYEDIENMTYDTANDILKCINYDNFSIIKTIKAY